MIDPLWPTIVINNNINNSDAIESAFQYIMANFDHNSMPSNSSGKSLADKEYLCKETKPVINFIRGQVEYYLKNIWDYNGEYNLKVHATDHEQIVVHNHSGAQLSGVFYLMVPQGDLVMYDPRYNANRGYPTSVRDKEFPVKRYAVTEGDCIVFPSFLWHESTRNASGLPRIIMPFDVWLKEE